MRREPAALAAVIVAVVTCVALLGFGKELSDAETAALLSAATLVAGFFVRQSVTPTPSP